uniref:Uncharacterized protein LOC113787779 n=1 Tax=Cicer arietinum TaxID=3827 RepID=A0A3Q7YE13_CICAR|nr:uncharacterized protein LOC113787779 [Cicer arietinum]
MMVQEFRWRPYLRFQHEVPEQEINTWTACTYLHCYHIVEKHHADRVALQFDFHQQIPQPPEDMTLYHEIDMRRGIDDNWSVVWKDEIQHWNERQNYILQGQYVEGVLRHTNDYMNWFTHHTKLYISVERYMRDPRLQPSTYPDVHSMPQSIPQQNIMHQTPSLSSPQHFHEAADIPTQYYVHSMPVPTIPTPINPTESRIFYNLFGTHCTTPESAYTAFDSMYNVETQNYTEAGGSSSNPQTYYNDDQPQQPQVVQRARRIRRPCRCGTGGHLDDNN